jgi:hypothetical protein
MIFGQFIQNLGYLKIASLLSILALTATADKATRKTLAKLNLKIRNYLSPLIEKFKFRGASCF